MFLCQLFLLPSVFADCVNSDMMTYRGMIRQKLPMNPDHAMMATHSAMNMYFYLVAFPSPLLELEGEHRQLGYKQPAAQRDEHYEHA